MKKSKSVSTPRASKVASVIAVVFALIWAIPVLWMVLSAIQPDSELMRNPPRILPSHVTAENFAKVFENPSFYRALGMSAVVGVMTVLVTSIVSLLFATALSRFRFRGRTAMIIGVLVIQMIPAEALFISQYRLLNELGLLNSAIGLGVLYIGMILPFVTWMLRGFVDGIPVDLEEAAMIDGCSRIGGFVRVTLPLLVPGIVSTSIFAFLFAWNEYTLAMVVLSRDNAMTLPVWLQTFHQGMNGTDWGGVMAGATVIAIPVIIVFVAIQSKISQGMVAGAVKG